jgi:hypothetical protein
MTPESLKSYVEFCENSLWVPWKEERLSVPEPFDRDAIPEPYVYFRPDNNDPLIVLTTNPGATMCHQCRLAVKHGSGPVRETQTYDAAARELGQFYEKELGRRPAGVRIRKMLCLSEMMQLNGVLQVEAVPFHSPSFPQKRTFLRGCAGTEPFFSYAEALTALLHDCRVVAIQASNKPERNPSESDWLSWIARTAGLDTTSAQSHALKQTKGKSTVVAWTSPNRQKAIVLSVGGTWLPSRDGLRMLAEVLRVPKECSKMPFAGQTGRLRR